MFPVWWWRNPLQFGGRIWSGQGLQPDPSPGMAAGEQPLDLGPGPTGKCSAVARVAAPPAPRATCVRTRGPGRADAPPPRACRGSAPTGWSPPGPVRAGSRGRDPCTGCGATASEGAEALFDPAQQAVGAEIHVGGGRPQARPKVCPSRGPRARSGCRTACAHGRPGQPPRAGRRLQGHVAGVAQIGLPALTVDGGPQAGTPQALVAEVRHLEPVKNPAQGVPPAKHRDLPAGVTSI